MADIDDETPERMSADQMDEERREKMAYEYLCRLDEARSWISECINEELPPTVELEESARNGVVLAKLSHFFAPEIVPEKKIFDSNEERYKARGLHFRHTDNIMHWRRAMQSVGLPEVFYPETTDVYDKKNMPKSVFCLHALSLYLFRRGLAPPMRDGSGNLAFTKEEIAIVAQALAEQGVRLPNFSKIGGILTEELSADDAELHKAVVAINQAIDEGDAEKTLEALQNPKVQMHFVIASRAEPYQKNLSEIKANKSGTTNGDIATEDLYDVFLRKEEIQMTVDRVNESEAINGVNYSLLTGTPQDCIRCLQDPTLRLPRVWPIASPLYHKEFQRLREEKGSDLEYGDILKGVHAINAAVEVNQAVDSGILETLITALNSKYIDGDIERENGQRYMTRLHACKEDKQNDVCPFLSLDEIKSEVQKANRPLTDEEQKAATLSKIQKAISEKDEVVLREVFDDPNVATQDVNHNYLPAYLATLKQMEREGIEIESFGQLDEVVRLTNLDVAQTISTTVAVVEINEGLKKHEQASTLLNRLDTYGGVLKVKPREELSSRYKDTLEKAQELKKEVCDSREDGKWYCNETSSGCPLFLNIDTKEATFRSPNEPVLLWYLDRIEIVTLTENVNTEFDEYYISHTTHITKSQAHVKAHLARKQYKEMLNDKRQKDEAATKIQRFYRRQQSLKDYQTFTQSEKPELRIVRMFANLLVKTEIDYEEEIELERIRSSIAKQIRSNQNLEDELSVLDVKIGLLVKNRLGVEDVMKQSERISKNRRHSTSDEPLRISRQSSVKKSNIDKIEAYQHLLYSLQTEPVYLTRLLLTLNSSKVNRLVDSIVFPLFNYATQRREEYLLLNLLKEALTEEVQQKIGNLQEFGTVPLIVPRIIINLFRSLHGEALLREMFERLVKRLLDDKTDKLNTNPLEIYEYAVGEPPEEMTAEEAAVHVSVAPVLEKSMEYLAKWANDFTDAIVDRPDHVPYGLRYMAKVLHQVLRTKFPQESDRDVLKAVGHLVYDEYLYAGVATPDAVGVYTASSDQTISGDDRKKFASVAKLLQCSVANRGYGHETAYLSPLNDTIQQDHEKFRIYFENMCKVDEPEDVFGIDRYSDYVRVRKPTVFLALGDLLFLHQLLLDNKSNVAPDSKDDFHRLLAAAGTKVPKMDDAAVALGYEPSADVSHTQICLALSCSKPPVDSSSDDKSLFLKTKKLVLDLILCQNGDSLSQMLATPATEAEEDAHIRLISDASKKRQSIDSIAFDEQVTLEGKKTMIKQNLDAMEARGLVTKDDDYQNILTAIATDVRRERKYRKQRKGEITRLQTTVDSLDKKQKYYDEQIECYDQYIKGCLENLAPGYKRRSLTGDANSKSTRRTSAIPIKTLKYSGEKLAKKGVLLSVNGREENQLKGINFEIKSSEIPGVFEFLGKFPALEAETIDIRFQELLHAQYEGSETMILFGKAKFHVDELIFFLNKKFYCS